MTRRPAALLVGRQLIEAAQWVRRNPASFFLLLSAYLLLIVMRGVIAVFPLRWITGWLGAPMLETPKEGVPADQLRYARRVNWAIHRVSPQTPTNSNCYPQALAAWWLLRRKRIPTTIYYGAAFDEGGTALEAHVWLRCGDLIVTGGGAHRRRFAPLTWFAHTPPPASAGGRRPQT
jgi:hypothetical protein